LRRPTCSNAIRIVLLPLMSACDAARWKLMTTEPGILHIW
jgi:hypothetical protein